jgi:hypothetical protein
MVFILVDHMDEVLTHALILKPGTPLFNGNDMAFDIISQQSLESHETHHLV